MRLNTVASSDDRRKALVLDYADVLADLGVISDDDYKTLTRHLEQIEEVEVIAAGIESRRTNAIRETVTKLATEDITSAKVTAAVAKLPAETDLHDTLLALWREHLNAARKLTFSNLGAVPDLLTDRLAEIAAEGLELVDQLAGVRTAEDAIAAGVTKAWTAFHTRQGEYAAAQSLVAGLRAEKLIPGPRPTDTDLWAWNFATRPEKVLPSGYRSTALTDDELRRLVVADWAAGPLVARDAAHAAEIAKDARAAEVVLDDVAAEVVPA